jgi:hypothetical protein
VDRGRQEQTEEKSTEADVVFAVDEDIVRLQIPGNTRPYK